MGATRTASQSGVLSRDLGGDALDTQQGLPQRQCAVSETAVREAYGGEGARGGCCVDVYTQTTTVCTDYSMHSAESA